MPEGCINAMGSLMPLLLWLSQDGGSSCPLKHRIRSHGTPDLSGRTSRKQVTAKWITVRIKASKTDPFRVGVTIYVGATGKWLCPVAAVLAYMVQRGSGRGPLFQFSDRRYLTRPRFIMALRTALRDAGIDATQFAGHSFRIGAATTASLCGIQDSMIQTLGRWCSAAYTLYIQTPPPTLTAVSKSLTASV